MSNLSPGVQILCDICTGFGRYLYSMKCSWIIKNFVLVLFRLIYLTVRHKNVNYSGVFDIMGFVKVEFHCILLYA